MIIYPVPGRPKNNNRQGGVDDEEDSGNSRRQSKLIVLEGVFIDVESGEHRGIQRTAFGHDIGGSKDLET
jgi:hypothetical protein